MTNADMFPPNIPAMTGAAVAVGQKTHMKAPSAMSGSQLYNDPKTIRLPIICMEISDS